MSFPVAVPDRRLLPRRSCVKPCVVHFGPGATAAARLIQSDLHGARLRLLNPGLSMPDTLLVVADDGHELLTTRWRIGDVLGLRRISFSAERVRAFRRDQDALFG